MRSTIKMERKYKATKKIWERIGRAAIRRNIKLSELKLVLTVDEQDILCVGTDELAISACIKFGGYIRIVKEVAHA